jgi:hypothetical protein
MELEDLEKRIKLLELVSDNVLPISAIGAASALLLGPAALLGVAVTGWTGISIARKYAKEQKPKMEADLDRYRRNGEISDKKYQELTATLNKLTVEITK